MRWAIVWLCVVGIAVPFSIASAGEIKCHVTLGGADVAGATVTLEPGAVSQNTDAHGLCTFTGLAAGKYKLIAEKTVGGVLNGAISDVISLGATEGKSIDLALSRAIRINEYIPLRVGNFWQYRNQRTTAGGTTTNTRRERAVGTDTVAGDPVTVIEVTWSGTSDSMKMYQRSDSDGYGVYREARASDTLDYVPPIKVASLLPLGYTFSYEGHITYASGAADSEIKMECRLVSFDAVTVPAGTFTDCPRLECKMSVDGALNRNTMWFAKGVGTVRNYEKNDERENKRSLEEYKLVPGIILPFRPLTPRMPRLP